LEEDLMKNVVIAGAARTPMGGFQGVFETLPASVLGGVAIKAALEGAGAKTVDEVLMGCVLPAGQGQAPARQAGFAAGLGEGSGNHPQQDVWFGDEGRNDRL
jgi:acetyl-CoA C-acetyltransferase